MAGTAWLRLQYLSQLGCLSNEVDSGEFGDSILPVD